MTEPMRDQVGERNAFDVVFASIASNLFASPLYAKK